MTRVRAFKITNFIQRKHKINVCWFHQENKNYPDFKIGEIAYNKSLREIQLIRLKYR